MKYFYNSLLFIIFISCIYGNKIAVTTKVKGLVEIMPIGKENFANLKPGTILSDGDKIRTGSSGFTAIIFIDDKSTLKLKENSEAVITGQRSAQSIAKKINMDVGTVRATVNKQNSNFVIQTPTSVASVKGTDFWMITDPVDGDLVIGLDGIVTLTNNETGAEVDVTEGTSGSSTPDGDINLEETEESSIPEDPSVQDEQQTEIKIYFEGPNGEQKVMIIEYQ
tara:strand:+ start:417 stop:1085 length:669 start_codon:yes stop_codon:yes gene_type:complete